MAVNLVNIDSDNGLLPSEQQAIKWTNIKELLIGLLGINFSEIWMDIHSRKLISKRHLQNGNHIFSVSMYQKLC